METVEDYDVQIETHSILHLPETITLEILPKPQETVIISTEQARVILRETQERQLLLEHADIKIERPPTPTIHPDESIELDPSPSSLSSTPNNTQGVHFLTNDDYLETECIAAPSCNSTGASDGADGAYERKKSELLEYVTRHDGSVICKRCGELLASRTHWYRHKYKTHVVGAAGGINPAPLFKCSRCNVYFKSKKGYLGHTSARHADNMEEQEELNISIKEEVVVSTEEIPKGSRRREIRTADWAEQRSKEEELVAAIIDRVKKECEAQGQTVTRRGYNRRSTVMMMNTS